MTLTFNAAVLPWAVTLYMLYIIFRPYRPSSIVDCGGAIDVCLGVFGIVLSWAVYFAVAYFRLKAGAS